MSENSQLAQMAKNFKQSASEQRQHTEKSVRAEFKKLNGVIESESINAQNTYTTAINDLNRQHWLFGTLSALPLLVVFLMGCGLTAWLCLSDSYGIYSKSQSTIPVQTFTVSKMRGRWARCEVAPVELQSGHHACMVLDTE